MLSFPKWLEAHHSYDNPDWDTKFQPLKKDDTFRVFHGFNNFRDAYRAAVYGLTGREYADRRYSYEADNNPYGLFVTLHLKKAGDFTSGVEDQVVMEFNARESDLEAPVWPGGSYTVQGQMAQYFGHNREGKLKRRQRGKAAQGEVEDFLKRYPDQFQHIRQSDDKYKANILLNSSEYQALFVGDLNPKDIAAFHVRPKGYNYKDPFVRLSREEFLERYKDYKDEAPTFNPYNWPRPPEDRMFLPGEEFDGDKFMQGIKRKYRQDPDKMLKSLWGIMMRSPRGRKGYFMDTFQHLLWPKQYAKAMWFMKNRYGKGEE